MKRSILFFTLTVLLSLAGSGRLFSQQIWSLTRCIDYAIENNIQIKQQEIAVEQGENTLLQSKLNLLPSVNASVGHNLNWGKSVNIQDLKISNNLTQSTSANISASLSIFNGFSKLNEVKSSKYDYMIAEEGLENLKKDITLQITRAYLQVLLSMEIEKSANENLKSVEEQVERTKKLVEVGNQAYSTLTDMLAQLASEKVQAVSASNNVRTNYLTLTQLLDLPGSEEFAVSDAVPSDSLAMEGYSVESVYSAALSLPVIKSAELALEKSKIDYKIQKGSAYPTISLSAGYGTYFSDGVNGAFFSQFNDNRNPSMSFSLSIPIFNGWRTNTSIRNAKLNIKNAEFTLQKSKRDLYKEIQLAYNEAVNAYTQYNAAYQNLTAAKESFSNTENKFNVGVLNGTDYIVAKNNLFKASSDFYQSKYQFLFQIKILDFYKGAAITLSMQ